MEEKAHNERREFLKKALVFSAATAFDAQLTSAAPQWKKPAKGGDGFTFLFQGDSITDGNRTRNNDWNHVMGHGYQYIIASKLWYDFPKKGFHFFNRGISGNKVTDLTARWQKDTLELNPDVLSILVGINDTAVFLEGKKDFTVEQFENGYRLLLQQTKQQLPNIEFVLCEPFILPVGKMKDKWQTYSKEIKKRQEAVQRLSEEHNAIFVPFQSAFDKALSRAPADYWIWDGVHPMPAGHELMAREWIHRVGKKLKFIKG